MMNSKEILYLLIQLREKETDPLSLTRPQIDALITSKMKQIEETGLSREEILFNQPKGIPLKNDAFFQYIKNNPLVRPLILLPSMTYEVESVRIYIGH